MADTVKLTAISSRAWEHPADRAALNALRALPGFDEALKRVMGFLGERGVRQLFLANAVRVGPEQRPNLNKLYSEVLETLDAPERWDLYVSQTPVANAMAVGFQKPFIVFHSGMMEILDEDERRAVLAHEVGHIMSGHPTYTTLAIILLTSGLANPSSRASRCCPSSSHCSSGTESPSSRLTALRSWEHRTSAKRRV
jgi:Zn-dependent protease with chaperone function